MPAEGYKEKGTGMRCPNCGSRKFRVGVLLAGKVACQFDNADELRVLETSSLESSWDPDAECSCMTCSWSGTAADAGLADPLAGLSSALSAVELANIERELQAGDCPEQFSDAIRKLVDMVRSLQNQLQIIRNVNRGKTKDGIDSRDTAVF